MMTPASHGIRRDLGEPPTVRLPILAIVAGRIFSGDVAVKTAPL
jgi:hypothetical protein